MKKLSKRLLWALVPVLALIAVAPASADWVHFGDSRFLGGGEKHPTALQRSIVLPTDAEGDVLVCMGYVNNLALSNRGRVDAQVEISRQDQENPTTFGLSSNVRRNGAGDCQSVKPMKAGDVVVFNFQFKGMPRVGPKNAFQLAGAVAIDGASPLIRDVAPTNPGGGGGGGSGGGGGGGGGGGTTPPSGALSGADQVGIVRLRQWASGSRGVQLRLQGGGRHYVDRRVSGVISAVGPYSSIAPAVNAHCAAAGGCGSGGALSGSDQSSVVKLQRWASPAGKRRLGLRFESGGRVHIDWIGERTTNEGVHTGPFSSITAAVNNFCKHPSSGGCG